MSQTLQIIIGICSLIALIGSFYKWHHNSQKELQKQIDDLKLQMKDLEKRDDLQQNTIDHLKDLFPTLKSAFEYIQNQKQLKK
jgi:predicted PurR-regulated permease PerM